MGSKPSSRLTVLFAKAFSSILKRSYELSEEILVPLFVRVFRISAEQAAKLAVQLFKIEVGIYRKVWKSPCNQTLSPSLRFVLPAQTPP